MMGMNKIAGFGAALLGLGVILGAFGAHYLKPVLSEYASLETYKTANIYHFIHALAILVLGHSKAIDLKKLRIIFWIFLFGIFVFSGSLYVLSITDIKWLGAITPIGGLAFITAWFLFTWQLFRNE